MQTKTAKVTPWKPKGLIKVRATQISDSQHNIKTKQQKIFDGLGYSMWHYNCLCTLKARL